MDKDDRISHLLEAFQECERRGQQARLLLETRNGHRFVSLSVEMPREEVPREDRRRKSPSTLRRDRDRRKAFLSRKELSMSWQPTTAPTSTPAPKNQDQSEPASLEATNQNQCAADSQPLVDNSADEDLGQISSHNTQKDYLDEKQIEPLKDLLKNWVNQVRESLKTEKPNNIKDTHDDEQCREDDNIEAAKIWAKKQKQSCLEKQ